MDLTDYLAVLRRQWLVIAVVTVLGAAAGFAVAKTTEPLYRSTTSTFVSLARGETVAELVQGTTYTQNLVESFTQLATTPAVLDPVIADLDLGVSARELARTITAVTPLDTLFVEITATATEPGRAAAVADGVAASLARTVATVTPGDEGTRPVVRMTVVADAQVPTVPFTPSTRRDVLLGALVGLPLGVLLALGRALLGSRVRTERGLPERDDRVVLGRVPREPRLRRKRGAPSPDDPVTEAYAHVRQGMRYVRAAGSLQSFVVTSSTPREGAASVALPVATALAHDGTRVLLVEADLRAARGASGLDRRAGLTSVLLGDAPLAEAVQPWGTSSLDVLTSGPVPPNPTQLLESAAMASLLDEAREAYDVVVLDAPALLSGPDAAVLAARTDGAVLVVGAGHVRRKHVADALALLDAAGAPCLGVVFTAVPRARARAAAEKPAAAHVRTADPRSEELSVAEGDDAASPTPTTDADAVTTEAGARTRPERTDRRAPAAGGSRRG